MRNCKVVLNGAAFLSFVSFLLLGFSVCAKCCYIPDNGINDEVKIIVSDSVAVYGFVNQKNESSVGENNNESAARKGELFISEGTVVYGLEAVHNVEIKKLNKDKTAKNIQAGKISAIDKEKKLQKESKTTATVKKTDFVYNNSRNSNSFYVTSFIKKIFISQNRIEYLSKTIIQNTILYKRFSEEQKYRINYKNPVNKLTYFSGKHSVRPPTQTDVWSCISKQLFGLYHS